MTEVVVVGMAVTDVAWRAELTDLGHHVAFLQLTGSSIASVLTGLADRGARDVTLVGWTMSDVGPARSWLRRVASHWLREYGGTRPDLTLATQIVRSLDPEQLRQALGEVRPITDTAAGLTSPAWEQVPAFRHQVLVCRGPRCGARGADATAEALSQELMRRGLDDDDVLVTQTGCLFPCNHGPVLVVHPDNVWYGEVTTERVPAIVDQHLVQGRVVTSMVVHDGSADPGER